jgi:ABC-type multidrug transport system fused ATPase/permease subunit
MPHFKPPPGLFPIRILHPGAVLSLIATILGKVVFFDFNWFVGLIGIIMLAILIFIISYDIRSRRKQKEQYGKDTAAMKAAYETQIAGIRQELKTTQDEYSNIISGDTKLFDSWEQRVNQANEQYRERLTQEQKERFDVLNKSFNDEIDRTKTSLTDLMKTEHKLCTDWQNSHMIIHEKQEEYNTYSMKEHEKKLHSSKEQELPLVNQTPLTN